MGTDRHENYTISLGIFKGQQRRTGHRKRRGAFTRTASLSRTSRFQGHELLQRKDNSSRVLRRRLRVRFALPHWSEGPSPCPGWEY
ncbi:hypothetical protein JTE90_023634 [Oedothorax gibbosus]|uniref:Uncharacterized protein n=1 Tax=Oedothorax gibbosus TaxID=931172 RepID=A0AAV6TFC5_9ARAC|nr:hypothetical protein JTE90_023634 [Oedothorax gibbosus]